MIDPIGEVLIVLEADVSQPVAASVRGTRPKKTGKSAGTASLASPARTSTLLLLDANSAACQLFGFAREELPVRFTPEALRRRGDGGDSSWLDALQAGSGRDGEIVGDWLALSGDGKSILMEGRATALTLRGRRTFLWRGRPRFPRDTDFSFQSRARASTGHGGAGVISQEDIERRVAERTRDLAQANERLVREIAERRKVEEALLRSERIYREAIESASAVPYRLLYAEGKYEFVGKRIRELVGIHPEKMTMENIHGLIREIHVVDPEAPSDPAEAVRAFRRGDLHHYRTELRIRTVDGEDKWLMDSSVPIRDEHGNVIGSLGFVQDITIRKRMEDQARIQQERLIQADKLVALGTLVSGVAHEINNPNHFIMSNTSLLLDAWQSIEPILERYYVENGDFSVGGMSYSKMRRRFSTMIAGVLDGSKRIKTIVDELRDFARYEPSNRTEPVDLNAVVKSAVTLIGNRIAKHTRVFHTDYDPRLPMIHGNFQRLEQVVINLVQNACQALRDPGKGVFVSTAFDRAARVVSVVVRDEGVGIPEEDLRHIADPFFTTRRESGGTGLGLSISSSIVNEHGGAMTFDSVVGVGTTVTVALPLHRPRNPSSPVTA